MWKPTYVCVCITTQDKASPDPKIPQRPYVPKPCTLEAFSVKHQVLLGAGLAFALVLGAVLGAALGAAWGSAEHGAALALVVAIPFLSLS